MTLFICTGNYYRSRFAEIYFNFLCNKDKCIAYSKGLDISNPDNIGEISPFTIKYLDDIGVELPMTIKPPSLLNERDFNLANKIIALNRNEHYQAIMNNFPNEIHKIEFWEISDLYEESYTTALTQLKSKVENLVENL